MIGQFKGRQKTNVYGWVSDLAVARSGFNQIGVRSTGGHSKRRSGFNQIVSNPFKTLLLNLLPARIKKIHSKIKALEWSQYYSDPQWQLTPWSVIEICRN